MKTAIKLVLIDLLIAQIVAPILIMIPCTIYLFVTTGNLDKVTLTGDKIRKYFPKSYTPQQMEATIIKLLEGWYKKRQQSLER